MIDELSALRLIEESFPPLSPNVSLGIGDDATALKHDPTKLLLVTTDTQAENVHFTLDLLSAGELARKALAVSVSDIGAMGGEPTFFLCTLGFTKSVDTTFLKGLIEGFRLASKEFETELVGGNVTASSALFIEITVLGEVEPDVVVKRTGASPGDAVYVTGTLGDSSLGLKAIKSKCSASPHRDHLITRHTHPYPRLAIGRKLALRGLPSSMIDISDGLLLDLQRITSPQELGAEIHLDRLPISEPYRVLQPQISNLGFYTEALSGGEDYELLFTAPLSRLSSIDELSRQEGISITNIGQITDKSKIRVIDPQGRELKTDLRGYIHKGIQDE